MTTAKNEKLGTVQDRVRYVFDKTGKTQQEFAEALGIGQPHLSGVMTSRKPSRRLLLMIGEKTGASLDWLETGEGKPYISGNPQHDPPELTRVLEKTRMVLGGMENEADRFEMAADLMRILEKREKKRGGPATGPAGGRNTKGQK